MLSHKKRQKNINHVNARTKSQLLPQTYRRTAALCCCNFVFKSFSTIYVHVGHFKSQLLLAATFSALLFSEMSFNQLSIQKALHLNYLHWFSLQIKQQILTCKKLEQENVLQFCLKIGPKWFISYQNSWNSWNFCGSTNQIIALSFQLHSKSNISNLP